MSSEDPRSDDAGSVLLLTGPPGSGKTTVAEIVASKFDRSVHVEADRFFSFVIGGYVDPWDPDAHEQNAVVMEIATEVARRYAEAGYFTILEGIFIPGWFFEPTRERLRSASLEVASAILRPPLATTVARARLRTPPKRLGEEVLEGLWRAFRDLGPLERYVIENDSQDPERTAEIVIRRLQDGSLRDRGFRTPRGRDRSGVGLVVLPRRVQVTRAVLHRTDVALRRLARRRSARGRRRRRLPRGARVRLTSAVPGRQLSQEEETPEHGTGMFPPTCSAGDSCAEGSSSRVYRVRDRLAFVLARLRLRRQLRP
jgi:predicted kinase